MMKYALHRFIQMIITLVITSFVIYGAMQLVPGDPVVAMFYPSLPSPERMVVIRHELGLDRPFMVRYWNWLTDFARGDFGESFKQYRPVSEILSQNIPPTVELAIAGMTVAIVAGLFSGILAGVTGSKWLDNSLMVFALIGISTPSFWLGILLMMCFSLWLGWFPSYGVGGISRLVLPALTLGLYGGGYLARFARSSILDVRYMEYVVTARSKGLTERRVAFKHILRNAMIPIVTIFGVLVGRMLGGAVIVETVFGRSGLGHQLVRAIMDKDFPVVQAILVFIVGATVVINLLVDISYAYIDPRIKYE